MSDKTALNVSPELRQYIEALTEEVVLEGKSFDSHRKYLERFCSSEGFDYEALGKNLSDFFDLLEEWGTLHTKASSMMARMLGRECFLSAQFIDKLLAEKEQAALMRREAERKNREEAERKAKAEAERRAREEAERRAEEENKAREKAEAMREVIRRQEEIDREIARNEKRIAELEEKVRLKRLRESQKNAEDPNNFVYVKGGSFEYRGEGFIESQFPPVRTKIPSFRMGKYVVTQEQWIRVMGSYSPRGGTYEKFIGDKLPAVVKWSDAQRFVQKLNRMAGRRFKIPLESEWDYAATGGQETRHYRYCGGNDYDKVAWRDTGTIMLHEVGLKRPNELGIYDMCGNVEEWCESNWIIPGCFKGVLKGFPGWGAAGIIDNDLGDNSDGFKSIWARQFALEEETMASFRLVELSI